MKIVNPATGEVIETVTEDTPESLREKFLELQRGQKSWAARSLQERLQCIQRFAQLLEGEKETLAKTLTQEMGKPLKESMNEIQGALGRIKFFIEESEKHLAPRVVFQTPQMKETLSFEPLGVLNSISAWNYPYLIAMNVLIPGLIGGNALLYKPSELTTLTGRHMQRLFWQAGVPEDVLQLAVGTGGVGEASLELPFQGFYFTGSYPTGKKLAQKVGDRLVPLGLELGGKDPLYVTDEVADLRNTALAAVEGSFYNNGQSCCAVERIYVHERVYEPFLEHFLEGVQALKVGDPLDPTVTQGPLARFPQVEFLWSQVRDAVGKGAKLVAGGTPMKGPGAYFPPTVLVNVDHTMSLMKEESFGPLIGIQKVREDEEALRLMQDTEYGLTAAVYASNLSRGERILQKLDVGTGYLNCCDRVSPYLPWSGRKHSGLGSTLSYLGILAFVRPKAYHIRA